jgi:hypothetical protein
VWTLSNGAGYGARRAPVTAAVFPARTRPCMRIEVEATAHRRAGISGAAPAGV